MTYGFKIIEDLKEGLNNWMDKSGHNNLSDIIGRAVPNVTDWQYLNLNYVAKARINQDSCIKCGRCHIAWKIRLIKRLQIWLMEKDILKL